MIGKAVFYGIAALCLAAFSPSVSYADCPYSKKEHKSGGFWSRLSGGGHDDDKERRGHKKHGCGHGYGHGKCGKSHKMHAFWWRSSSMAEMLRLDEGQVARLDEIHESHRGKMWEASEKAFEAKWEFRKLMRDPESSADDIRNAAEKMYKARTEKKRVKLEKKLAMRDALRPGQIRDMQVLKRKGHKGGCGHGKGHR